MIRSTVRCVFFDAVGTLMHAQPHVSAVYHQAGSEFRLSLDEAAIEQRFNNAFHEHFGPASNDGRATNEDLEKDRWRAIVAAVFGEASSLDSIFERLWLHFAMAENWRTFEDVGNCIGRLHDRGLTLGVASNFDSRLINICRGLPAFEHCEHVFCSSRIGWRKPAAAFFRAIERSLDLEPQQILLVGDDFDADYQGALDAGWQAILLDRSGTAKMPAIRSLDQLF